MASSLGLGGDDDDYGRRLMLQLLAQQGQGPVVGPAGALNRVLSSFLIGQGIRTDMDERERDKKAVAQAIADKDTGALAKLYPEEAAKALLAPREIGALNLGNQMRLYDKATGKTLEELPVGMSPTAVAANERAQLSRESALDRTRMIIDAANERARMAQGGADRRLATRMAQESQGLPASEVSAQSRRGSLGAGKPVKLSEAERRAELLGPSAVKALDQVKDLIGWSEQGYDPSMGTYEPNALAAVFGQTVAGVPVVTGLASKEAEQYTSALKEVIANTIYGKSGADIPVRESAQAMQIYGPQPGESVETVTRKIRALEDVSNALLSGARGGPERVQEAKEMEKSKLAKRSSFESPEQVRAAYKEGRLDLEGARKILQTRFGMK